MTLKELNSLKDGDKIKYIGDSFAFEGEYKVISLISTYIDPNDCPKEDRDKCTIVEFMNDGTPMFFPVENLNPEEWEKVN